MFCYVSERPDGAQVKQETGRTTLKPSDGKQITEVERVECDKALLRQSNYTILPSFSVC